MNLMQLLIVLFGITAFLSSYCYLTWSTYPIPIIRTLCINLRRIGILGIVFVAWRRGSLQNRISTKVFSYLLLFIIACLYVYHKNWIILFEIIAGGVAVICLKEEDRAFLFRTMIKCFAIMVLPSLIYFLLELVGVRMPSTVLQSPQLAKSVRGLYYSKYFLGLIIRESTIGQIDRFCGIFDEAGYIGSMCALFIASGYGRINRKWITLLFVEGFLSFSMAFYLIIVIFIIVKAFIKGALRFALTLLSIVMLLFLFLNVNFSNPSIQRLQSRIDLTSSFLIEDNRLSQNAQSEFNQYIENGGIELWLGNGMNAANENSRIYGSSSYMMVFYDYGILGILLYYGVFAVYAYRHRTKQILPFLVPFIASIYQRPYIFTMTYFVIFCCTISFMESTDITEKTKRINHEC